MRRPEAGTSLDRTTDVDSLVDDAITGDPRAQNMLLAQIQPAVLRYCRARHPTDAEDVAQEVLLAVFKALPTYRHLGRPFLAFVYGIAAHKITDARRASARNRAEPVPAVPDRPSADPDPVHLVLADETFERIKQLVDNLPDRLREILVLRVSGGLSAEQTAHAIGSTPGAVRVAQPRALTRVRKTLEQQ